MKRCKLCLYPDTKPDLPFTEGVCQACINYERRPKIDWAQRKAELEKIIKDCDGRCVVASSGGKDSHFIALTLIELGARPTIVTATTDWLTPTGRHNIDNLARFATTIEVTANRTVRAKLNRYGLELVGDISWPEHASIFTVPRHIAVELGISVVFYGENPQHEYGGPLGAEQALEMNRRWITEFGGFLGLRPADFVGKDGITAADMADYETADVLGRQELKTYFLGQFLPWSSHKSAAKAFKNGMIEYANAPCPANYWGHENLDNAMTGLHDHFMFRKYGYGRGCAQISHDIRRKMIVREEAELWLRKYDGLFPERYLGVYAREVIRYIGMEWRDFLEILDRHTNWEIFKRTEDELNPMLKEDGWRR